MGSSEEFFLKKKRALYWKTDVAQVSAVQVLYKRNGTKKQQGGSQKKSVLGGQ